MCFGEIDAWFQSKGIANILSIKTLKRRHHVTFDSQVKVHTTTGLVRVINHESGSHYLDLINHTENGVVLVTIVVDDLEGFANKPVKDAIKAQRIQAMLGHPSKMD